MAAFVKYNCFVEHLAEKVHNLGADSLKLMLTNRAPVVATDTLRADAAELATANGYTSGGNVAAILSSAQAGGVYTLALGDPATWIASGGSVGPFRYAILYNDTPTAPLDPLIGYWDYGSSITLLVGETIVADFGASALTLT
jgi:hypothetical protein